MKKKKMSLPNNVSEEEFLQVIENISKRLAYKFKFGYHSYEDMKQQATIFALEGLKKYDKSRPLENFLWTHVRNRLFNYKRDNYQRPDKPCLSCRFYDKHCNKSTNQCTEFSDKNDCEEYDMWYKRNNSKKNIMKPSTIDDLGDTFFIQQKNLPVPEQAELSRITEILDKHIPAQHRENYLKLKHGDKIYKTDLDKIIGIIKDILKKHDH